jgi:hypothetical protein
LWQSLTEHAERLHVVDIKLDINLAAIQEGYHASWRRRAQCERRELWRTEIPLFLDKHLIGQLNITGGRESGTLSCELIGRLMEMLEPLEAEIVALASTQGLAEPGPSPPAPIEEAGIEPSAAAAPASPAKVVAGATASPRAILG